MLGEAAYPANGMFDSMGDANDMFAQPLFTLDESLFQDDVDEEEDQQSMELLSRTSNGAGESDVTLVRVLVSDDYDDDQGFLTLRCFPTTSVSEMKRLALEKVQKKRQRKKRDIQLDPAAYVFTAYKEYHKVNKGKFQEDASSDLNLSLPEYVPFLEHFGSELDGAAGQKLRVTLKKKVKPATVAKGGRLRSQTTVPKGCSRVASSLQLVRVFYGKEFTNSHQAGDLGANSREFLTLRCTKDSTVRSIKEQALVKIRSKGLGTHLPSLEPINFGISAMTEEKKRTSWRARVVGGSSKSGTSETSASRLSGRDSPSQFMPEQQLLTHLFQPDENILKLQLTSAGDRDFSLSSSLHPISMSRDEEGEFCDGNGPLRLRGASAPVTPKSTNFTSCLSKYKPEGDFVLLRVIVESTGKDQKKQGFVTIKCHQNASVMCVKEQVLQHMARRMNAKGARPADFVLWRDMGATECCSDREVNNPEQLNFWEQYNVVARQPEGITKALPKQITVYMTPHSQFVRSRWAALDKHEVQRSSPPPVARKHSGVDFFKGDPVAVVQSGSTFDVHGADQAQKKVRVWYEPDNSQGKPSIGVLRWEEVGREAEGEGRLLLRSVIELYVGSHWFPDDFDPSASNDCCMSIEWLQREKSNPSASMPSSKVLHLSSSHPEQISCWMRGLYSLLVDCKQSCDVFVAD